MKWIPICYAVIAIELVFYHPAASAQQNEMAFTRDVDTRGTIYIRASGEITEGTAARLRTYLAQFAEQNVAVIALNSEGGLIGPALELGREIRRSRLTTNVDQEDVCLSACAYAFLGGEQRAFSRVYGEDWSEPYRGQRRLGFHAMSFGLRMGSGSTSEVRDAMADRLSQDAQGLTAILSNYVAEMTGNVALVSEASGVSGRNFKFFDLEQLVSLNIITDREVIDIGDWVLRPDSNRIYAAFVHQNHQFSLVCRENGTALEPVLIMSQAVAATRAELPGTLNDILRPSSILAISVLPWTERDNSHSHFHAHEWFTPVDFNPVFGFVWFRDDGDSPFATHPVTNDSVRFRTEQDFFHAEISLTQDAARRIVNSPFFHVSLSEHDPNLRNPAWSHGFRNTPDQIQLIQFALRDCIRTP